MIKWALDGAVYYLPESFPLIAKRTDPLKVPGRQKATSTPRTQSIELGEKRSVTNWSRFGKRICEILFPFLSGLRR